MAREMLAEPATRPRRLIVACHYPVVAPPTYASELKPKRMKNAEEVARLAGRPSARTSTAAATSTPPGPSSRRPPQPALPQLRGPAPPRPDRPPTPRLPRDRDPRSRRLGPPPRLDRGRTGGPAAPPGPAFFPAKLRPASDLLVEYSSDGSEIRRSSITLRGGSAIRGRSRRLKSGLWRLGSFFPATGRGDRVPMLRNANTRIVRDEYSTFRRDRPSSPLSGSLDDARTVRAGPGLGFVFPVWPRPVLAQRNPRSPTPRTGRRARRSRPRRRSAKMTVPPGFRVELVASEPDIVNPVAMTFDERGRVWITESLEYPRQSAGPGPRPGQDPRRHRRRRQGRQVHRLRRRPEHPLGDRRRRTGASGSPTRPTSCSSRTPTATARPTRARSSSPGSAGTTPTSCPTR